METAIVSIVCIALIFVGAIHRFHDLQMGLLYLSALSLLPVAVMILAWLDLRELQRTKHERQAELYRNLAQLQQELRTKPPKRE